MTGLLPNQGRPAVCPNGHAMDDGLFECPACGAYRPSTAGRTMADVVDEMFDEPDTYGEDPLGGSWS